MVELEIDQLAVAIDDGQRPANGVPAKVREAALETVAQGEQLSGDRGAAGTRIRGPGEGSAEPVRGGPRRARCRPAAGAGSGSGPRSAGRPAGPPRAREARRPSRSLGRSGPRAEAVEPGTGPTAPGQVRDRGARAG